MLALQERADHEDGKRMNWLDRPDTFGVWWVRWPHGDGYAFGIAHVFNLGGAGHMGYHLMSERGTWFPANPRFANAQWQKVKDPEL